VPTLRKLPIMVLTLLGGLLLWMPLTQRGALAGDGATVSDATYGDPPSLMAPYTLMSGSDHYITFKYDDFSDVGDRFQFNNSAAIVTNSSNKQVIRLTPAETTKGGSVFNKERVSLKDDRSFSTYFTFELSGGSGWADGLVFTVQTDSSTKGSIGGTLGYYGIAPSVAVKFDTYRNTEHGDPSDNHIAILKDGVINSSLQSKVLDKSAMDLRSGTIHVWIDYNGPTGLLEVRMNKNSAARPDDAVLSYTLNPRLTGILNTDWVYVGFTASTGGYVQNHDITSWYFTNKFDPIDIENITYKQAPTGYAITPVPLEDGTVELTITPIGGDNKHMALTIEGTNGAVISPAAADTGEEGQAAVIASSPDGDTLLTKITVTGPGGVASSLEITIPGRTEAPIGDHIAANATDGTVDVTGVPDGATVAVYDHEGNRLALKTGVTGGNVQFTGLDGLTATHPIAVTFEVSPKVESEKTSVVPKVRSALDASDVQVNATTDKASIRGVPAGAVIRVYDAPGGSLIGEGTNTGVSAAALVVQIDAPGVDHRQKVYVTIEETGKLESLPVEVAALAESAKLDPDQIETDGTADLVTVRDVPAGATIVIYDDEDGRELGRGVNAAAADADVTANELGLVIGMSIRVALIEPDKLESEPVTAAVAFAQSDPPGDIDANATKSVVTVADVPPGALVTVYDEDGDVLGTNPNTGTNPAAVSLTISSPRLTQGQALDVTLTESRKTESVKVRVAAEYERSAKLAEDRIVANATDNTVTVTGVPSDAVIIVYNSDGSDVLGTDTNVLADDADLTITPAAPLTAGDTVLVTITEQYRLESDPAAIIAREKTAPLPEERIRADASASRITFRDIPDGAEIVVYNDRDERIASVTNNRGEAADLTVDVDSPKLVHEQPIRVTIREPDKLVSDPTTTQAHEQSAMPKLPDVLDIDVAAGTVKMGNVPPGTAVILYDPEGAELGRGIYNGAAAGEIVIAGLSLESAFQVTYTEPNKYESDKLNVRVDEATLALIDDAIRELEIGYQDKDTWESVTQPVFVVSVGKHDTSVSWTSSKPDVITITEPTGNVIETIVNRKPQDESVILTAKVSKNGMEKTRTFLVIVKAVNLVKTIEKDTRQVKVTGGMDAEVEKQVAIDRIVLSNGSKQAKIDKAVFDATTAAQFVSDVRTRNSVSRIYVDEVPNDEPDEFAVEVPEASMRLLADHGNSIEVRTDYGGIAIDNPELVKMADQSLDLYFRLVPVKDADEQRRIHAGIRSDANVRATANGRTVDILGSSLKVETNYSGYTTMLTLYFEKNGIRVPAVNAAEFFDSLRLYIDHGDGSPPEVADDLDPVDENGILVGLSLEVDKFSTFTIMQLRDRPAGGSSSDAQANPDSGLGQIVSAAIDPSRQAIVLEMDGVYEGVDPGGFEVSARGEPAAIAGVTAEGRYVTIRLNDPLPAGYRVAASYSPKTASAWTVPYLRPFSGLLVPNPGFHAAYMIGFEDGTFRPNQAVTRAEIAAILARNMNLPAQAAYRGWYPDVSPAHWAWSDIERLKGAGLLVGDTDGRFRPQDAITRAEMAMIAARWLEADLHASPSPSFSDVGDRHWAAAAITAAARAGVIVGYPDGTFGPDAPLTRAQAVAIMNRLLGRGPLVGTGGPSLPDVGANHWAFGEIEEASHSHPFMYDADGSETESAF